MCLACVSVGLLESEVQGLLSLCRRVVGNKQTEAPSRSSVLMSKKAAATSQRHSAWDCAKMAAEMIARPETLLPAAEVAQLLRSVQVLLQPTSHERYSNLFCLDTLP